MFQLCFNFITIHDIVGKALRTADQDHVTVNSHALSSSSGHLTTYDNEHRGKTSAHAPNYENMAGNLNINF